MTVSRPALGVLCLAGLGGGIVLLVGTARLVGSLYSFDEDGAWRQSWQPPPLETGRTEPFVAAWREWEKVRPLVEPRDLTLRVGADEEFRARSGADWREDLAARIHRASTEFEAEFRIRLVVGATEEWSSDDDAPTIHDLHRALAAGCDDRFDVTVAFVRQLGPTGRAEYESRGVAYYYGRCCIVRTGTAEGREWPYEDETTLHEIAHLFGAWHPCDDTTVMRRDKSAPPRRAFDVAARTAVLAARTLDFRRGLDGLDDATLDRLAVVWRASHAQDAFFPPIDAVTTQGVIAEQKGDCVGRDACACRARALDARFPGLGRPRGLEELIGPAAGRGR